MEKLLIALLILTTLGFAYFGILYMDSRAAIDGINRLKMAHDEEITRLKRAIGERDTHISDLEDQKLELKERLTMLRQDFDLFPDTHYLTQLAERLRPYNSLEPDTQLGKLYLNKPILVEQQYLKTFFSRKGTTTMKFIPGNIVAKATFPEDLSGNETLKAMKHSDSYRVNFTGRIAGWNGNFIFKDCRLTGIWAVEEPKK
jgi:hypothetical protein